MGWGTVGDMYLLRLESKLVWVHILERGNSYASVSLFFSFSFLFFFFQYIIQYYISFSFTIIKVLVKGLELQETSCHHAEAGKVSIKRANSSHIHSYSSN